MKARYLLLALLLAGCAQKPVLWEKDGVTQSEFDSDIRWCEFEMKKATQTTDPAFRSVVGQEMDRAMRQRDLMFSCLRMKGYTQR